MQKKPSDFRKSRVAAPLVLLRWVNALWQDEEDVHCGLSTQWPDLPHTHIMSRRKPDTVDCPVYAKFKGRWNWLMMVGTRIMVVFAGEWVTGMRHERGIWRARLQMVMVNIWETSLSCPGIIYVIFYMHVFCMHISLNENYTLKILLGMTQGTQMGPLWQHRRVGWGERWEEGWRGRGHMYTYGWTMLMYGRNQHNIVIILKLKINKEKKSHRARGWDRDSIALVSFLSSSFLTLLSANLLPSFPCNQVGNLFNQEGLEVWFVIAGDVEIPFGFH